MEHLISGFLLGGSLIVAIGAQNAFVLRQGLMRSYVLPIVLVCAVSDALLLCLGVLGVGAAIGDNIYALTALTVAGVVFLGFYGGLSVLRAWRGGNSLSAAGGAGEQNLAAVMGVTLALTYLNPHVYLDTVVIFGSLSAVLDWHARWYFLAGGVSASFVWFFLLGYGAQLLIPLFQKSLTWRLLDLLIAAIMFWLAGGLLIYIFDLWEIL